MPPSLLVLSDFNSAVPSRRLVLQAALAATGCLTLKPEISWASPAAMRQATAGDITVANVTGLYTVPVAKVSAPISTAQVVHAVHSWPGPVCVGGGRYSMGGQIAVPGGLHLDMRNMTGLVWLRPQDRTVRVQAGMRWRDLQDHIDPHDLAVRTMQSYANFTVGGSVSVNAHGRYVGHGPVSASVQALQIVLPSGQVLETSRTQHAQLFRAALGGYGCLGVITEVELSLDVNLPIARSVARIPLTDYPEFFRNKVQADATCLMHNADLLPPNFDNVTAITWHITEQALTDTRRLTPRGQNYRLERTAQQIATGPGGDALQTLVMRPARLHGRRVVWRNHEASLDAAALEPHSRGNYTFALQEYFVPMPALETFVTQMTKILRRFNAQVLNVSIRQSPPDTDSLLAWARQPVFSLVLYYRQGTDPKAHTHTGIWTRALVGTALEQGGTYYLPYQLHASLHQFEAAYPQLAAFRAIKAQFDPKGRMRNMLWDRYGLAMR